MIIKKAAVDMFKKIDQNKDGRLSEEEFLSHSRDAKGNPNTSSLDVFEKMDRNQDGYLSRDEFKSSLKKGVILDIPLKPSKIKNV
jgi:Ca2+-binding EF-hand superfamily protein